MDIRAVDAGDRRRTPPGAAQAARSASSAGPLTRKYEDFLRGLTKDTVDAALRKGEFDFVEEISADFPIQVLARLLDVPDDHTGQLIDWGNRMIGNTDPDYADVLLSDRGERPVQAPAVPLAGRARGLRVRPRAGPAAARAATATTWSASWSTAPRRTASR